MTPGNANPLRVEPVVRPELRPRTPVWHVAGSVPTIESEAGIPLDLRTKRDLHSRRVARQRGRTLARLALLLAGDTVVATAAVLFGRSFIAEANPTPLSSDLTLFIVITILGQAVMQTYGDGVARRRYDRVWIGVVVSAAALAVLVLAGAARSSLFSPDVVLGFAGIGVAICAVRYGVHLIVRAGFRYGHGVRRTVVIGDAIETELLVEKLRLAGADHIKVIGRVVADDRPEPDTLGTLADLHDLIESNDVSNLIISAGLPPEVFKLVVHECLLQGVAVGIVPSTLSDIPCQVSSREIVGWPMIELEVPRLHLLQVALKRSLDITVATLGLVVTAPVMLVLAIAIRVDSPGPILFGQRRPGLGGKPFTVYKFRTMRADAEEIIRSDPALYKRFLANDCKLPPEEDPRITRFGNWLRTTSLDELPQLFNVLLGQMSLVGPRPVVGPELENYGAWTKVLLAVKPGVTGYWQINGRSSIRYPERAHLDLQYITQWSLAMDLKILLRTVPAVLKRIGAH